MPDVPPPGPVPPQSGRLPGVLAAVAAEALNPAYRAAASPRTGGLPTGMPLTAPARRCAAPRSAGLAAGPPAAGSRAGGRGAAGPRAQPPARHATRVLAVALGMLLALAGATQRAGGPARARLDAALVAERDRREVDVAAQDTETAGLRATVAATRAAVARDLATGRATAAELGALQPAAAAVPATGAGLRVEITDARPGDQGAGPRDSGARGVDQLTARDLASLVNALWAGHATAIAVNGVRLSTTSPIRTAGDAILVDFQPVASPYRIDAVGDPAALRTAFLGSVGGRLLAAGRLPGARLGAMTTPRVLAVPAARQTTPRLARRLGQ